MSLQIDFDYLDKMSSLRLAITTFISAVATTGADALHFESTFPYENSSSLRTLNTFTALNPASAPIYFSNIPKEPWISPGPSASSSPPTRFAMTPSPSSQPVTSPSRLPSLSPTATFSDALAGKYPSYSPLSAVLSFPPHGPQTLSPSIINVPQLVPSADTATIKSLSPLMLPNFPAMTPSLGNSEQTTVTATTTQPTSDAPNSQSHKRRPTQAPTAQTSKEDRDNQFSTQTPSSEDQQRYGDNKHNQAPSSYFEAPIPKIQIHVALSLVEIEVDKALFKDKLQAFFLEVLATGPNSMSFVTADLFVDVEYLSPLVVLLSGKVFYEREDHPTYDDITAHLRTYFSLWGTDHLQEYLGSDRVDIELNGEPVSSQTSNAESNDVSALSIFLSVVLILIAAAMFSFGVFTCRRLRNENVKKEPEEAAPQKVVKQKPSPPQIVMSFPRSLASLSLYDDADREYDFMTNYPPSETGQSSLGAESNTFEKEYGLCSL
jgi:hypothetical protein